MWGDVGNHINHIKETANEAKLSDIYNRNTMSSTKFNAAKIFAKWRSHPDQQVSKGEADHLRSKGIKIHPSWVKKAKKLKEQMSEEQKRKLLIGLRRFKEGGNIGGTTDIVNPDNFVAEDEFTAATKPETNVIAKTFDTTADFDSYVNQRRGIEITPKEQQALMTERSISELAPSPMAAKPAASSKPTTPPAPTPNEPSGEEDKEVTVSDEIQIATSIEFVDETQGADILADFINALGLQSVQPQPSRFGVKFEQTDGFGLNDTTIIKKLRKGGKFCWTAFSKHESAKDEGNPEGTEDEETP